MYKYDCNTNVTTNNSQYPRKVGVKCHIIKQKPIPL